MEVKFCDLNPIKVLYASTDCVLGLFIPVLHFVLYIYIFSKKKTNKKLVCKFVILRTPQMAVLVLLT